MASAMSPGNFYFVSALHRALYFCASLRCLTFNCFQSSAIRDARHSDTAVSSPAVAVTPECMASCRVTFCEFALCRDKAGSCLTLNPKLPETDIRTGRDIYSRNYTVEACFVLLTNNNHDLHAFTVNQTLLCIYIYIYIYIYIKVNFTLEQATKAQKGSRSIALLLL